MPDLHFRPVFPACISGLRFRLVFPTCRQEPTSTAPYIPIGKEYPLSLSRARLMDSATPQPFSFHRKDPAAVWTEKAI